MNRLKVFFLNSILMIIASLILQIIKSVFNIYVSNKVSSEALGVFQLIMATYYFGITIASSGISLSCMKIVSEEFALGNNYGIRRSSIICLYISICISLIASFLFFKSNKLIVQLCFKNKVSSNIVYLICTALPLISVSSAITGYFIAVRRVYKTIIGQFLEQISKIIATILLFNYTAFDSIESICFSLILGDVISELISFIYLIIVYIYDLKIHFFKLNISSKNNFVFRIFRVFLPIAFTSYIKSGISTFKQVIIPTSIEKSGNDSTEALSIYGIISGMAMPIIMFPAAFLIAVASLLIPEFSRYYIKKDYKKIGLYTDKLLIGTFLFSIVLTVLFCIFAHKLSILLYHNSEVGTYIKLFSLLIPFIYVDIIIDNILKGLNAQTNVMFINIIDLVFTTLFICIFVPIFGIKGYILSIFVSEFLNLFLSLRTLLKIEKKLLLIY